ncbi:MAG: hypothetical protein US58_C0011G0012 [Candidatus Magasanikbacteria bacterium GW2011_GWA2_37_8]|uniref:Glycosyl transferase family 1 n=1 Tax=Candidatus Magasanikbacteria bacterium GW2011_GWA2_37_8 TaxID=1619036 RepID=A0A0G0HQI4_9BACT|nr:MAG: hypothetical protein US58_C0011G0012 [Candidatus Magasanikbacteria bacterium GW2011_GWA2_37_8]
MRIAMIGQKGLPAQYGGIERHVEELSLELVKQNHEVLAYARAWYSPKAETKYQGIKIIHTPTIHSKHLDAIIHTFTATIHAIFQKPDVIHYHGVGPALMAWIPRVLTPKTKVIVTFHCIDRYHQKWGWLARQMLRLGELAACYFPHETISVSKTIYNYCINEYQSPTTYIPNGVNLDSKNSAPLQEFGLEENKFLVMVSRLVPHKGAHYLISAWQEAKKRAPELLQGYKLAIVGGSAFTDKYVTKLNSMIVNDKSVVLTGWQQGEKLMALFKDAKMLVHPSENEGMSLSILRAMSLGKPVLLSDIAENRELIPDPRFWFINTDVESLTKKIIELMSDEKLLTEGGEMNKKMVTDNFLWDDIAKQTEELYIVHSQ